MVFHLSNNNTKTAFKRSSSRANVCCAVTQFGNVHWISISSGPLDIKTPDGIKMQVTSHTVCGLLLVFIGDP